MEDATKVVYRIDYRSPPSAIGHTGVNDEPPWEPVPYEYEDGTFTLEYEERILRERGVTHVVDGELDWPGKDREVELIPLEWWLRANEWAAAGGY